MKQKSKKTVDILSVFPNPTSNKTYLDFSLDSDETVSISLFDVLGQIVKQFDYGRMDQGNHQLELDLADLINGIYSINITTNQDRTTKNILINHQ
jgi:Secretion system C-terminal sorting domain